MTPETMWKKYQEERDLSLPDDAYEAWHFSSREKEANELAELTRRGIKRATAGLVKSYEAEGEPLPSVGEHHIITDWDGNAVCVIRIQTIELFPFNEVTERHARIEGEGGGSLDYWVEGHRTFFKMDAESLGFTFEETDEVAFLIFEVVYPVEGEGKIDA